MIDLHSIHPLQPEHYSYNKAKRKGHTFMSLSEHLNLYLFYTKIWQWLKIKDNLLIHCYLKKDEQPAKQNSKYAYCIKLTGYLLLSCWLGLVMANQQIALVWCVWTWIGIRCSQASQTFVTIRSKSDGPNLRIGIFSIIK
jgi:hypothetical protein